MVKKKRDEVLVTEHKDMRNENEDHLVSIGEAAKILGVCQETLKVWGKKGIATSDPLNIIPPKNIEGYGSFPL